MLNLENIKDLKRNSKGLIDIDYILEICPDIEICYKVTHGYNSAMLSEDSPFMLKYYPGQITKAIPNTMGIILFERLYQAENFIHFNCLNLELYKIRRVFPIGKKTIPDEVSELGYINIFYSVKHNPVTEMVHNSPISLPPIGTICYPAVIVCNEEGFKSKL